MGKIISSFLSKAQLKKVRGKSFGERFLFAQGIAKIQSLKRRKS